MDKLEQARSAVRGTWLTKITDRTFLTTISTAVGVVTATVALWQTPTVPVGDKINATMAAFIAVAGVVAFWNGAEKSKDAAVWSAALQPEQPAQLAVGNVAGDVKQAEVLPGLPTGDVALLGGFGEPLGTFGGDDEPAVDSQ